MGELGGLTTEFRPSLNRPPFPAMVRYQIQWVRRTTTTSLRKALPHHVACGRPFPVTAWERPRPSRQQRQHPPQGDARVCC